MEDEILTDFFDFDNYNRIVNHSPENPIPIKTNPEGI